MFLYGKLIAAGFEPAFAPILGLSYQLEDREFLRLITPVFTICKHTKQAIIS